MITLMSIVTIALFIIVSILDRKEINSLKQMGKSREKYIALLEKRARQERLDKNKAFNKNKN